MCAACRIFLGGFVVLALAGCTSSTKYQTAPASTPPAVLLNRAFESETLQATLTSLIIYGGPGSWKREALWDEYVVTLRNPTDQPLTLTTIELVDFADLARPSREDPWQLEVESKTLCKEYDRAGLNFVKESAPVVLTVGGIAAGSAVFAAAVSGGGVTVTVLQGPLATITVPSALIGRAVANHEDRADIEADFRLRRLALPFTLAPGQTRAGCLFFPMVPNPRALRLRWQSATASGEAALALDFLRGLHVKPASPRKTALGHHPRLHSILGAKDPRGAGKTNATQRCLCAAKPANMPR